MKQRNPVAKHSPKFNRPSTHKPRKGKGSYRRSKNQKNNPASAGFFLVKI